MMNQVDYEKISKAFEELGNNIVTGFSNLEKALNRLVDNSCGLAIHRQVEETIPVTWAELGKAAKEGQLDEYLKSGDTLPLVLKNGEDIGLEVGRDETGRFFFIFKNIMENLHEMNEEWTNKGGWAKSDMRKYVRDEVFPLLPDDLQAVIRPITIRQCKNGIWSESEDKLFCLSATQVFGKNDLWNDCEPNDTQIDIFKDPHKRIKMRSCDDYSYPWWLRSAYSSGYFRYVYFSGAFTNYYASTASGVVLGFSLES